MGSNRLQKLGYGYVYDFSVGLLYLDNDPINLSQKEQELLRMLLLSRGYIVTYIDIDNTIYINKTVSSSARRTLISRLRRKLNGNFIQTVNKLGIKIELL